MARLAFDIDDTITDSTSTIKKYILMHKDEYEDGYILTRDLDIILRGFFNDDVVKKFFEEYAQTFANEIELRKDAAYVINKLKSEGHEIYIITARSDRYYKDTVEYCSNYLKNNGVNFDKILVDQKFKINCCKENNIDVMVDDGVDTCDDLNSNGINAILFTSELNKDKESISIRVNSWLEVYDEIHKIIDKN